MRIYISGPITGHKEAKSDFDGAARRILKKGHVAVNPYYTGWILPDGMHTEYMLISMKLVELSDAMFMLPGWEQSRGAKMEHSHAKMHGMPIYYEPEEIPVKK